MDRTHNSRRRSRRGAAAIEFAMTAPILLAMSGGVVEWGWFMNQQVNVIQAARDGARAGSLVDPYKDDPATVAEARMAEVLGAYGITVRDGDVDAYLDETAMGEAVVVTAEVDYMPLLNLVPMPARLRARTIMRLELQP